MVSASGRSWRIRSSRTCRSRMPDAKAAAGDLVDELGDRRPGLDHLDLGVVVGPGGVAEQAGELLAQREHLRQQRVVLGPAHGQEGDRQLATGARIVGEGAKRQRVRVVRRHGDQPVLPRRVGVDPVLRQPGEPVGRDPDRAHVVADVLAELLADEDEPLLDGLDPLAGRLVLVDPGPVEVQQGLVEDPLGRLVQPVGCQRREDVVEVAVQAQLGVELEDVLHGDLGPGTHRLDGVHLAEQRRHRCDGTERDVHVVPAGQRLQGVGRPIGLDGLDPAPGLVQAVGGSLGEPLLGGVDGRQGQAALLVGHLPQPMPASPGGSAAQAIPPARHTGGAAGIGGRSRTSGS